VIDHHRRGKEVIEDTLLIYQEPYASSTCELVTELLQYLNKKTKISKIEAEALLAGIYEFFLSDRGKNL
jgi:c-di-AMP phosphodiesterase-like protein